jgi:hypothetical protein
MKAEGNSWAEIGRRLGIPEGTAIERGRRIGAAPVGEGRGRGRPPPPPEEDAEADGAPRRAGLGPPLEPGHPLTWGALWPGRKPPDFKAVR